MMAITRPLWRLNLQAFKKVVLNICPIDVTIGSQCVENEYGGLNFKSIKHLDRGENKNLTASSRTS